MQDLKLLPYSLSELFGQLPLAIMVALLVIAAVIDWRTLRIPNWLTFGGTVAALLCSLVAAQSPTILWALAGLGVGLIALLPLYVLGIMGAGDVKLMAMVGAFLGLPDILYATLCTFAAGGVAAIAFALYLRAFRRMAGNVAQILQAMTYAVSAGVRPSAALLTPSVGKLPYGVSISAGTIGWLLAHQLGIV